MLEEIYVKAADFSCIDSVVKEGDAIKVHVYKELKAGVIIKVDVSNEVWLYLCSCCLNEILHNLMQDETKFNVIAGINKTTPQKHKEIMYSC